MAVGFCVKRKSGICAGERETERTHIKDLLCLDEAHLEHFVCAAGFERYRAKQLYAYLAQGKYLQKGPSNIPRALEAKVKEQYALAGLEIMDVFSEQRTQTKKFLYKTEQGFLIESVAMQSHYGLSVCVSTQAGCRMGCRFCQSGKNGLLGQLKPSEMFSQVVLIQKTLGKRVRNLVLMGSGEPLDNYENVVCFLRACENPLLLGISRRHITLSTCGLADKIDRLAEEDVGVELSISLHHPIDEERKKIMPVANRYCVQEIFSSAKRYRQKTNRRVSFEYALIEGQNDSKRELDRLAALFFKTDALLNIIPVNENRAGFRCSKEALCRFAEGLRQRGINFTVRRKLGSSINAACGQLVSRYEKGHSK